MSKSILYPLLLVLVSSLSDTADSQSVPGAIESLNDAHEDGVRMTLRFAGLFSAEVKNNHNALQKFEFVSARTDEPLEIIIAGPGERKVTSVVLPRGDVYVRQFYSYDGGLTWARNRERHKDLINPRWAAMAWGSPHTNLDLRSL